MALTSITMASGVTLNGRALARNGGVTLINDKITNSCSAGAVAAASSGVPNTAFGLDSSNPGLTTALFALILVLGLGAMAVVDATIIRRRS